MSNKLLAKFFNSSEEADNWIKKNPGIRIIGIKTTGSIEIYYEPPSESELADKSGKEEGHIWRCDYCPPGKLYPWCNEERPTNGANFAYFH